MHKAMAIRYGTYNHASILAEFCATTRHQDIHVFGSRMTRHMVCRPNMVHYGRDAYQRSTDRLCHNSPFDRTVCISCRNCASCPNTALSPYLTILLRQNTTGTCSCSGVKKITHNSNDSLHLNDRLM